MHTYYIRYESDLYEVVVEVSEKGKRLTHITRYQGPENRLGEEVLYRDLDEVLRQRIFEEVQNDRN